MMINKEKISAFDLKLKLLQQKKKKYIEAQSFQLVKIIKKLGAFELPSEVLVGALIDTVQSYEKEQDIIQKWQELGHEFLNSGEGKGDRKSLSSFRNF